MHHDDLTDTSGRNKRPPPKLMTKVKTVGACDAGSQLCAPKQAQVVSVYTHTQWQGTLKFNHLREPCTQCQPEQVKVDVVWCGVAVSCSETEFVRYRQHEKFCEVRIR